MGKVRWNLQSLVLPILYCSFFRRVVSEVPQPIATKLSYILRNECKFWSTNKKVTDRSFDLDYIFFSNDRIYSRVLRGSACSLKILSLLDD